MKQILLCTIVLKKEVSQFHCQEMFIAKYQQIIETTMNLFSKKTGGLSCITEDEGVSEQWISINQFISALQQHQDAMLNRNIRNQGY